MTERDRTTDEDMWRTSPSVKTQDTEDVKPVPAPEDDHAYEDSWYQVLRRSAGETDQD
jgi:hypothetical protein